MSAPVSRSVPLMVSSGQRGRPGQEPLDEGKIHLPELGSSEQAHEDGGHAGQKVGLYFFIISMMIPGSGRGTRMSVHARQMAKFCMPVKPAEWKKGKMAQHASPRRPRMSGNQAANCWTLADDVGVGEHHPLAHPGGAAGVDEGPRPRPTGGVLERGCVVAFVHEIHELRQIRLGVHLPVHLLS